MKMVVRNTRAFKATALAKGVRGLSGCSPLPFSSPSCPFSPVSPLPPFPLPFRLLFFGFPSPPFLLACEVVSAGLVLVPCPAPVKPWIVGLAAEKSHPSSVRLSASVVLTPVTELICWMFCLVLLSSLLVSELMIYCLRSSRPGKLGSSMNWPLAVLRLIKSSMSCGLPL